LIQYHGWNDSVVPPDGSVRWELATAGRIRAIPRALRMFR